VDHGGRLTDVIWSLCAVTRGSGFDSPRRHEISLSVYFVPATEASHGFIFCIAGEVCDAFIK
jgi:hypothetical protein